MAKVVCVGSANVDILLFVRGFCDDDGEQIISRKEILSGGQGGNIASGLGRLGKQAYFFGNLGDDENTKMLEDDFKKDNVDFSFVKRTKYPNNSVYILIDEKGNRRMYAYNYVDFDENDLQEELYRKTSLIVFSSLIKDNLIDVYIKIAEKAKEKGIKIALDPGNILARLGFEKLLPLFKLCDYFLPSLNEVNLLVGDIKNIRKISEAIPNVIVKCGENGPMYFKNKEELKLNFPGKKVRAIDSTGAGDCFDAAFLSILLDGKSEEEAIRFAHYAAALSVTKRGARSMPSYKEIIDFMKKQKVLFG
jgi:ribokinase